jgi:hypothetical protein
VGTNRYAYSGQDPVNKSDPNGHASSSDLDGDGDDDLVDEYPGIPDRWVQEIGLSIDIIGGSKGGGLSRGVVQQWEKSIALKQQSHHLVSRELRNDPVFSKLGINLDAKGNLSLQNQKGFSVWHRAYNKAIRVRVERISDRLSSGEITERQALNALEKLRLEARQTLKKEPGLLLLTKKEVADIKAAEEKNSSNKSDSSPSSSGLKSTGLNLLDELRDILGI